MTNTLLPVVDAPDAPVGQGGKPPRKSRRRLVNFAVIGLLIPVCLLWIYPLLWVFAASLKSNAEIFGSAGLIPEVFHWENYQRAWNEANVGPYFWNSLFISVCTVTIVVTVTAMIGYSLGRFSFPGKKIIIGAFLVTMLVPEGYVIIPIFQLINDIGLGSSLWGVILAESGGAHVIVILLFASYFRQIPQELEDAARIDGAGFFRTFWSVMLPLAKPVIATGIILTLMRSWNSFLIPLVLTLSRPDSRPLAVGVYAFRGENITDWTGLAAASTITLLPIIIVFLFLQRYFIEGMTGAVRG